MVDKVIKTIIKQDVFKEYHDMIISRIQEEVNERSWEEDEEDNLILFIYDCFIYSLELFQNNGWSKETDSYEEIKEVINALVSVCCKELEIFGLATWSDNMHLIYLH